MAQFLTGKYKKPGLAPGTLIHIGEIKTDQISITIMDYDQASLVERSVQFIEDTFALKETPSITWINITGIHQIDVIEKVGQHFDIHPLTLEDIVNTNQRPKMEDYDHYLYIVTKMLYFEPFKEDILSEQISIILGKNFLISFQETEMDVFSSVRERIRKSRGRIRTSGVDYLAYALMDAIVDHYFVVMGTVGERMESLEEKLLGSPETGMSQVIHEMKRQMIHLRKNIWPLREILANLMRGNSPLFRETTAVFLRDVYDHTIQVMDTIESYRDILSGMLDIYLSMMSNRMNEIMKLLTIIATIFIPITFIAGVYGMNFKFMPELEWKWGYFVSLFLMGMVAIAMLIYFRKKKWL